MAGMNDRKAYRMRMDGMAYALRVAEKDGIEGLRDEVKARGAVFIPLEVTREAVQELNDFLGDRILNRFRVTMLFTLNEVFGFGKERLLRFYEAFGKNCGRTVELDPFGNHCGKMSDYAVFLKEKYGIEFDLEQIVQVERENDAAHRKMVDYGYTLDFLREHGFAEAAECLREYAE